MSLYNESQLRQRRGSAASPPSSKTSASSVAISAKRQDSSQADTGRFGKAAQSYSASKAVGEEDVIPLLILTALAIVTRFHRLDLPPAVVFDELHFQKFVDHHLSGIWYFDIHPPLGKLILAYGGSLFGYRPDPTFVIEKIGNEYPTSMNYLALRMVSAIFSVLTVPTTYIIAKALRLSVPSAVYAAFMVLSDILGTIEGRYILMDSQLLFFSQLTLLSAIRLWRTFAGSRRRWILLVTTGISAGLALSIKHTALATPGMIAVASFFGSHFMPQPLSLFECAFAGMFSVVTYILPFYPYLTREWTTGGKYDKFMRPSFRRTIAGSEEYIPTARRPGFWNLFAYINRRMVTSNAGVKKRHSWESDWYQWVVSWRGVLYYSRRDRDGGASTRAMVYLVSNPVVIGVTLCSVVAFAVLYAMVVRRRAFQGAAGRYWAGHAEYNVQTCLYMLGGWVCNLAPYVLVSRAAFLYHYLPGLFYAQLLSATLMDMAPRRVRNGLVAVLCVCMAGAFVFWSPWVYAIPLSDEGQRARRLLPKWD